jgi:hypothetical protein
MPKTHPSSTGRYGARIAARVSMVAALVLIALTLVGCSRLRAVGLGPAQSQDAPTAVREIASEYAATGDLTAAQASLATLNLPNATQLVVSLADEAIAQGLPEQGALARLAVDIGAKSPRIQAYLQPTVPPRPTPSPLPPPTATPQPTLTPTETAAPTEAPATATLEPTPAPTGTATPEAPRAVAESDVNLRGGPGKQYPLVGKLQAGQEADIIGRNASGDWWQLDWDGQAWVAGTVVKIVGPLDTVAVARDIPAPPPTATAAPAKPTQPPAAVAPPPPPKASSPYVVKSVRVRPLGQDAQQCGGGEHNIFVQVVDPSGAPIDGVRIREVFTGNIHVTGEKGPGRVDYDIYMNGGGQVEVVDENNNPMSPQSRGMSANLPDWDLFLDAGYCNCKPYPDVESCKAGWEARDFRYMPNSHYVYEVVFQRTY